MVAAVAVLSTFHPETAGLFIYDRAAVLSGGLWRLITCHFVHYSATHLIVNLLVLLPVTVLAGRTGYGRFSAAMLFSALAMGAAFVVAAPEMRWYAGASGLANAGAAWLATAELSRGRAGRPLWALLLFLVFAKALWETSVGRTLFLGGASPGEFVSFPLAHLIGALAGAAAALPPVSPRFSKRAGA